VAEEETEGQAGMWGFGLRKSVRCSACTANVRSEDFWQFTKAQAVLFRVW